MAPPSRIRAVAEPFVLLSLTMGAVLAAGWWVTGALALPRLPPPPFDLLAWPVALASGAYLAYSARVLSQRGRGTPYPRRPPKELVTTGPYAHVRNPIILSWGGLVLGIASALRLTGLLLVLVPAAVAVHVYVVYHEEPILAHRFGTSFEEYCRRVPRWIPRWRT